MVVYSFFIFDRHAECIYKRQWPASLTSSSSKETHPTSDPAAVSNGVPGARTFTGGADTRLIFGAVYSLRNMTRKLGGEDDRVGSFVCYRTSQYKLHYYETPTNLKFVMLTDTKTGNMRVALHQIYVNLYVEYVVKNPLSPVEHPGGIGMYNELFEESLEQFVTKVLS
ncbi:TRAPP subunit bet5 [Myotisia sp. PD_48]|nr:TRAPP subunit bet5 [Myotisia sp. PD_48]